MLQEEKSGRIEKICVFYLIGRIEKWNDERISLYELLLLL